MQPAASQLSGSAAELFYRLSEDKLRKRSLWAGAALSLSLVMPYEIIEEQPQFLWQLFAELPPSGIVAALAEIVMGWLIVVARFKVRDASAFALVVITAMLGAFVCNKLGSDASTWGLLPLPVSFASRATLALIAMSATAAGTSLAHRRHSRVASTGLIVIGVLVMLVFYSWPGRGRAPGLGIVDNLRVVGDLPGFRFQLGAITLLVVALWPAFVTLLGLVYVRRPPTSAATLLPFVALFGFPLIVMMLLFARFARTNPGSALFAAMGAAVEITAVLALVSAALEMLGEGLAGRLPRSSQKPVRRAANVCSVAFFTLGVGMWWLARPPDKGVAWELGEASREADALFGERVLAWSRARWAWDTSVRRGPSARALVTMRERGKRVLAEAEPIDAGLAHALGAMIDTGQRLDASSRAFYRAVGDVNAACRAAKLPYYLDPEVSVHKTKDGLWRRFAVDPFRVVRARRFDVDGETYGTLHVRGFGERRGGHRVGLLGLSRDVQPFALVAVEASARHLDELSQMAGPDVATPRCGRTFETNGDAVLARCGALLAEMLAAPTLTDALAGQVERHELQHQIDGPLLPLAPSVMEKLAGHADAAQARVNRELSAYVAQLTSPTSPVHVGLIVPLRFALLDTRGVYHHAAVLLFEGMGARRVRTARGRVDPALLASVFDELTALDEAALRARAQKTWAALFHDDLAEVRLLDESSAPDAPW